MTSQYLRALMQKKMVCKSNEERRQLCDRLLQDATQLRELFCGLVRGARVRQGAGLGCGSGASQGKVCARSSELPSVIPLLPSSP